MSDSSATLSQNAVAVVDKIIDSLDRSMAAYIVLPNVVLTLSNSRVFADGVFYSEDKSQRQQWLDDLSNIKNLFTGLDIEMFLMEHTNPAGHHYVAYEIYDPNGLASLLAGYSFISSDQLADIGVDTSFEQIEIMIAAAAKEDARSRDFTKSQIDDVVQGVIFGYPEVAIFGVTSLMDDNTGDYDSSRVLSASISCADYYRCPQPVCDYPKTILNDYQILKHEQAWSSILRDFYDSDTHRGLENDDSFMAKVAELGVLEPF